MAKLIIITLFIILIAFFKFQPHNVNDRAASVDLEKANDALPKETAEAIDTLIDVGGYNLHFSILKGKGVPILFESGGGNDGSVWNDLLKPLYDSLGATLITYDRAGFGLSGIDTTRINLMNEVKDLEVALTKLGYSENIFLVSHSLGGAYSTIYASRNSAMIKGAVFIDVTLPCYYTEEKTQEAIKWMASFGIENIKAQKIGFYYIYANYENTNEVLRTTPYPDNIPSTIIGADTPPKIALPDSVKWKRCMKTFGTLPNHKYVLAKNSSHQVFKDNPSLVNEEIINLYRQVTDY